jgi:UDP-galactose transporter B1
MNLNYTVQVLIRSSKFLSIVLSIVIFKTDGHEHINYKTLLLASAMTVGIFIFHLGDSHKSVGTEFRGIIFGVLSLVFDCFVNHHQKKLKKHSDISFLALLQATNFWCFIFSLIYGFLKGEAQLAFSFVATHPRVLIDLVSNFTFQTAGIYFVYYHINQFGPESLAKVTTVRKCFSVLVSFVAFGHALNSFKVAGLSILFVVIFYELFDELRKKKVTVVKHKKE